MISLSLAPRAVACLVLKLGLRAMLHRAFDDPVVSVHNPGLVASGVPPAGDIPLPAQPPPQQQQQPKPSGGPAITTAGTPVPPPVVAPKSAPITTGVTGALRGRTAPEVPSMPKRPRVG